MKIYILLMHTNTIPARLVRFFTRYKYNHVALSLEESCEEIYSFGRKKVNSIFDAGFIVEKKDGQFFSKFKCVCKIYELDISKEQYEILQNILKDMVQNNIYKYDFIGIIPRFFGIPISFRNRFVCSNFVAFLLEKSGIYRFNKATCLVKPRDFETIPMKLIYDGNFRKE